MRGSTLVLLGSLAVASCTVGSSDGAASLGEGSIDTSAGSSSTTDAATDTGMKLDISISEIAEVFGHSGDMLYRLDPNTKEVTIVGQLDGCTASIIDIALDADSNMYGAAYGSLWAIDRTNGRCTHIADGQYPTSLSFVPAGTVDPDREALVGFVDAQYIRIDTQTGTSQPLGMLSSGLRSSGDMVAVAGGGSWLTVTDDAACSAVDCIIEIDPIDGSVLENFGPLPYAEVFGLAFWAGRAYGFARGGDLFEIDFGGDQIAFEQIFIPNAPATLEFFGAGSTTSAPPVEG
jgi:hypothetical protein